LIEWLAPEETMARAASQVRRDLFEWCQSPEMSSRLAAGETITYPIQVSGEAFFEVIDWVKARVPELRRKVRIHRSIQALRRNTRGVVSNQRLDLDRRLAEAEQRLRVLLDDADSICRALSKKGVINSGHRHYRPPS
jgi:hypothetical protein